MLLYLDPLLSPTVPSSPRHPSSSASRCGCWPKATTSTPPSPRRPASSPSTPTFPRERLSAAAAPNLRLLQVMEFGQATVDRESSHDARRRGRRPAQPRLAGRLRAHDPAHAGPVQAIARCARPHGGGRAQTGRQRGQDHRPRLHLLLAWARRTWAGSTGKSSASSAWDASARVSRPGRPRSGCGSPTPHPGASLQTGKRPWARPTSISTRC